MRFAEALDSAIEDAPKIVLEVGPGQVLAQLAHQHPARSKFITVCSTLDSSKTPGSEREFILTSLGKLWLAGVKPDWNGFYANEKRKRTPLPTYPFERKRHWVEPVQEPQATPNFVQVDAPPIRGRLSTDQKDVNYAAISPDLLEQVIHEQLCQMTEQLDLLQAKEICYIAPNS